MSSATTFFRSRWIDAPAHVTELDPHALPAGFRAAGVAAGLKPDGLDVGVLVSDAPDTVSAARFTTNALVAAPVAVSQGAATDRLRAIAVNSGNANVADGERGMETALATQREAAELMGTDHIGIGSDLCQDQPDSVVHWMRNGRWTKAPPSGGGFPDQPAWFRSNRDFGSIAEGLKTVGFDEGEIAAIMGGNWLRFFDLSFGPA